jgi:alkylhydroperoxidase family enzyme
VPDAVFEEARRFFSEAELVDLTLGIVAINGWAGRAPRPEAAH